VSDKYQEIFEEVHEAGGLTPDIDSDEALLAKAREMGLVDENDNLKAPA